uniref:Ubiquinone biosynthesis O-methyltransferase, mitochondrial n=1 Tax=Lygus hesperus TaxID=30085 RepID=A0A0K8SWP0_LYGHE
MMTSKLLIQRSFLLPARALHKNPVVYNSVDPKEVDHFTKFGDEWLNPNGPMKPLFSMNDLRIPFVRNGLVNTKKISEEKSKSPKYLSGVKILDVGCGGGILSLPLARLGADVTGLDPTPKLIEIAEANAKKNLPGGVLRFECGTIEEHSLTNSEQYDAIVCSEVIEHVPVKDSFVNSCVAATKPGGSLFYTTISQSTVAWVMAIIMAEYVLRLLPTGTHEYDKFITPKDLSCYLEKANCNVLTVSGMMYNPLTNKWSWCPYNAVNYCLHAIKRYK